MRGKGINNELCTGGSAVVVDGDVVWSLAEKEKEHKTVPQQHKKKYATSEPCLLFARGFFKPLVNILSIFSL